MSITFYAREPSDSTEQKYYNGRPLYNAWPRPTGSTANAAISWANTHRCNLIEFEVVENRFSEVYIDAKASARDMNSYVPQAFMYLSDFDVYVKVDFRIDGVLSVLAHEGIIEGKVQCDVSLLCNSSSYRIYPTKSDVMVAHFTSLDMAENCRRTVKYKELENLLITSPGSGTVMMYMGKFKKLHLYACGSINSEGTLSFSYIDTTSGNKKSAYVADPITEEQRQKAIDFIQSKEFWVTGEGRVIFSYVDKNFIIQT